MSLTVVALSLIILAILWDRRTERNEWATERADLLQRIQAPEVAVLAHAQQTTPPGPEPLTFDDDQSFWQSKEDLAERLR